MPATTTSLITSCGNRTRQVGEIKVDLLCDMWQIEQHDQHGQQDGYYDHWSQERGAWLYAEYPWAFAGPELCTFHIHAFLIRTPEQTILLDSGLGPQTCIDDWLPWANLNSPTVIGRKQGLFDSLRQAGVSAADVDHVVITHLHLDHIGGCLDDTRTHANFPNATYHLPRGDWDRVSGTEASDDLEPKRQTNGDGAADMAMVRRHLLALPTLANVVVEEAGAQILPGVTGLSTPGHTSGHRSILLESRGDSMLFAADVLHHPYQLTDLDWCADEDPVAARASRKYILEMAHQRELQLVIGHFAEPFGSVMPIEDGWRYLPDYR